MNLKIIGVNSFIVIICLFFILNLTYFDLKEDTIVESEILNFDIWFEKVVHSWSQILWEKIDEKYNFKSEESYVDRINYIDKVYFSTQNYAKKVLNNNITFLIWSWWIYIFDLYDLTNNYTIDGTVFKITPKSPGKIFVDNRNIQNIKIFSFDAIFDVSLMTEWKEMTNISLYTKMYLWFNASRNKFLKNADLFKIENISNIFYVKESILNTNNKMSYLFLRKINPKNDIVVNTFLNNFFSLAYSQEEINKYNESKIFWLSTKWLNWFDYINKYFIFFFNDEKKIIYYKKDIINNLNKLFKKNENINKENILRSLENLKALDIKEYNTFRNILYYYYDNILKINSIEYTDKTFLFSEIIFKDKANSKFSLLKSSFFLNKIYSLINNKTYNNDYLQSNFLNFLKYYFEENNLKLEDNFFITIKNNTNFIKIDYLLFFIKNILLFNLNLSDSKNQQNIFNILKIYINIGQNINKINDFQKSETLIVENFWIMDKLLKEVKRSFFDDQLNENWLLIISKKNELTSESINALHEIMTNFLNFYKNKKSVLSEKNNIYNNKYNQSNIQYIEYYDALNNYPGYLIKYDKVSRDLFDTKTIGEDKNEIVLSQENLLSYLNTFEWLDLSNVTLSINKDYYKIDNLNINGENFSFHLYPLEFYRMDNIVRSGKKLSLSYELSGIKHDWDIKFEDADDESKDKFDFKKFFINIFFTINEIKKEDFVLDETWIENEDKIIWIFKRDKLLSERGEFTSLKWFLDLKYKDIKVSLNNNIYDISLENILLKTSITLKWEQVSVVWIFNSKYVFNQKDHYFKNISLKFYHSDLYSEGEKVFLFDGKALKIDKNINIVDFKSEINTIITDYFTNN